MLEGVVFLWLLMRGWEGEYHLAPCPLSDRDFAQLKVSPHFLLSLAVESSS
jgi:hypothetical protein